MSKKMLINASHPEESRVAILEDGVLQELDIETTGREQIKGNIYRAFVVKVEPGLQAAFVDYGGNRHGFLPFGEIQEKYYQQREGAEREKRPRIQDVIHKGTELLVQVVKGERDNKGASLTTYISLAGRYLVLMPGSDTTGVSRKIESEEQRKKLKEIVEGLDMPDGIGIIIRTAGLGKTKQELTRDYHYLTKLWDTIESKAAEIKPPSLIYQEYDLVMRTIRDYYTPEIDEILIDDKEVFRKTLDFFKAVMPRHEKIVKLYLERRPIFSKYQTEEQIERIYDQRVPLKSGGSLVIGQTEALVAIDVNSGKSTGEKGIEDTAFKTNMEAADEVARQLRLRDMGGLIVIDFIDMEDRKHRQEVEKQLKNAFKADKARIQISKISEFGLLELSRQRIKPPVSEGSYFSCPHCEGKGSVKSTEAAALSAYRKLQAQAAKKEYRLVQITLPTAVALYLLNQKRHEISRLELDYAVKIVVEASAQMLSAQYVIETERAAESRGEGVELPEAGKKGKKLEGRQQEQQRPAVMGAMELFMQGLPEEESVETEAESETYTIDEAGQEAVAVVEEAGEVSDAPVARPRRARRPRRGRGRKGKGGEAAGEAGVGAAGEGVPNQGGEAVHTPASPEVQHAEPAGPTTGVEERAEAVEAGGEGGTGEDATNQTARRRRPRPRNFKRFKRRRGGAASGEATGESGGGEAPESTYSSSQDVES